MLVSSTMALLSLTLMTVMLASVSALRFTPAHEVQQVTTLNEYNEILKKERVCVTYFATWKGPSSMIAPKIAAFELNYPSVTFIKVDVDIASEVSEKEGISAVPTFKFFKGGKKEGEVVGASEAKIKDKLEQLAA